MFSRIPIIAGLPLASLLPVVLAIPEAGTIGYKFEKRTVNAADYAGLRRRQSGSVLAGLSNEINLYVVNVTVGTPAQSFQLQLDTGSSDIWFPSVDANYCEQQRGACSAGTYNQQDSSTYANPNLPPFEIQYVDGTTISGSYISDVLNIGSAKITNMTMASATQTTQGYGIMGVSFESEEAGAQGTQTSQGFTYPNLVSVMQSQGLIKSRMFSLWLDDVQASTGSILFGGVDTDKYTGDLVALPIQLDSQTNSISSFSVAWSGLKITGSGNNVDLSPSSPQAVVLDSGTTDTVLPDDIVEQIFNGVGVITNQDWGNVVPCSLANDDLTFTFTFGGSGGPSIAIPLSSFVISLEAVAGFTPKFRNGQAACQFAMQAAGGAPILFGDSFLRSAYVVYDLDNQQIAIAATNFNSQEGSGNVQVASESSAIPGVSSTATGASVAQTATGIPRESQQTASDDSAATAAQTSRSATFHLSATGSSSSSGSTSTSSGAASSNVQVAPVQWQALASVGVVALGLLFGGGLILV